MELVPVIDIMDGIVVRAKRGERSAYRPIVSALCASADPLRVARMLLDHCASRKLYVADLDALTGRPRQSSLVAALLDALPDVELWLDAAFATDGEAAALAGALGAGAARMTPVFGTESLQDPREARRCFADRERAVLSLDFRRGSLVDPAGCGELEASWPRRIIAMTLDRVGADAGPDLWRLGEIRARAPRAAIYGAGGVRHPSDLEAACAAGAAGWLVASSLHDLRIPPARGRAGSAGPGIAFPTS